MINGHVIADLHTHNRYSYDSRAIPARCYGAAARAGVDILAVTNHYDIDGALDGIYGGYDADADLLELEHARQKYSGVMRIIHGVELGQAHHRPREAQEFLAKYSFDYVLLSLHNMRNVPDFYYWDHAKMTDEMSRYWLDRYFTQVLEMLDFPRGDALAHLNYPYRYMKKGGRSVDFALFRDKFAAIFEKLITRGMALEVNASGFIRGMGEPLPNASILKFYRECGGELTVVGSDAHKTGDLGMCIDRTYDLLRSLGFKYTCVPTGSGFEQLKI